MSPFIHDLLQRFSAKSPEEYMSETCLAAEEAITKFNNTGEWSPGLVPELVDLDITKEEIRALTKHLQAFIRQQPEHNSTGSVIWALSKLNDRTLAPFFRRQIQIHYRAGRVWPVQQADYALIRLGLDHVRYEYTDDCVKEGTWDHSGYLKATRIFLRRTHGQIAITRQQRHKRSIDRSHRRFSIAASCLSQHAASKSSRNRSFAR